MTWSARRPRYRGLPRPGWKFSHWDGNCARGPAQDCLKKYDKAWVQWWDDNYPDEEIAPLTAILSPDSDAPAVSYITSRFGAVGRVGFAALLDAMFFPQNGSYRFTSQQAATRTILTARRPVSAPEDQPAADPGPTRARWYQRRRDSGRGFPDAGGYRYRRWRSFRSLPDAGTITRGSGRV